MIYVITAREDYFREIGWDSFMDTDTAVMLLSASSYISYDSETSGLGFMFSEIHSMQMCIDDKILVVDVKTIPPAVFKNALETKMLIGHNLLFDIVFLYKEGVFPNAIYDTFIAEMVCSLGVRNHRRSLDACLERHLKIVMDKSQRAVVTTDGIASLQSIEYAAKDVEHLKALMDAQQPFIKKWGLQEKVSIECEHILPLAYIEFCGFPVNKESLYKWVRRAEYDEYRSMLELDEFFEQKYKDLGMDNINWSSPSQVVEVFKKIGIDTFNKKEQRHSVEASVISKQGSKFLIVAKYLKFKEFEKVVSTYGRVWFDYIMPDGRIHTKFKPMVESGRMSCGDTKAGPFPNIQNVIADPAFRSIFEAPAGKVFVVCDYSGQESVIMADVSQEPKLLDFYQKGLGDMHSYVAKLIFHEQLKDVPLSDVKKVAPDLRQKSKSTNFAIQYGGTGYTIAENAGISTKEGDKIYETYMKTFDKMAQYFEKTFRDAMKRGYVLINPVSGGKRFIEGMKKYNGMKVKDPKFESMVRKMALNTPCQGTGADMTKMATIKLFKWIKQNKMLNKVRIVNSVHDELVVECSESMAENVAERLKAFMEASGKMFLTTLDIHADPVITKIWRK